MQQEETIAYVHKWFTHIVNNIIFLRGVDNQNSKMSWHELAAQGNNYFRIQRFGYYDNCIFVWQIEGAQVGDE